MAIKTKNVHGNLMNPSGNDVLAEIMVEVSLIIPKNPTEKPSYAVTATTENYRPDLSNKSLKLELDNKIAGEVYVTIEGLPSDKTNFKIFLQDNIWNNVDWFNSL